MEVKDTGKKLKLEKVTQNRFQISRDYLHLETTQTLETTKVTTWLVKKVWLLASREEISS